MSDYAFNYSFNITGNASTAAQQITGDVTALNNLSLIHISEPTRP